MALVRLSKLDYGNTYDICTDGNRLFALDYGYDDRPTKIMIYSYDSVNPALSYIGNYGIEDTGSFHGIAYDGTYIYTTVSMGDVGNIYAFQYNESSQQLEHIATAQLSNTIFPLDEAFHADIVFSNGRIYAASGNGNSRSSIDVFTFDGTNFTNLDSVHDVSNWTPQLISTMSGIVHAVVGHDIKAYNFDGSSLVEVASIASGWTNKPYAIEASNGYVFISNRDMYSGLVRAFSWDGSAYTYITEINLGGKLHSGLLYDSGYLYTVGDDELKRTEFDGTIFSNTLASHNDDWWAERITIIGSGDSAVVFTGGYSGVVAYAHRPLPSFTIDSTTGVIPHTITITNTSQDAVSYEWDFGDGSIGSTDITPSPHTYTIGGGYRVNLIAYDSAGNSATAYKVVWVNIDFRDVYVDINESYYPAWGSGTEDSPFDSWQSESFYYADTDSFGGVTYDERYISFKGNAEYPVSGFNYTRPLAIDPEDYSTYYMGMESAYKYIFKSWDISQYGPATWTQPSWLDNKDWYIEFYPLSLIDKPASFSVEDIAITQNGIEIDLYADYVNEYTIKNCYFNAYEYIYFICSPYNAYSQGTTINFLGCTFCGDRDMVELWLDAWYGNYTINFYDCVFDIDTTYFDFTVDSFTLTFDNCYFSKSQTKILEWWSYPTQPTFTNCRFEYNFGVTEFPKTNIVTSATQDQILFSNFNIPITTDTNVHSRWNSLNYNTGLFGEPRLGAGALYFEEDMNYTRDNTKTNYSQLRGSDSPIRIEQDKYINLVDFLPSYLKDTDTENFLKFFEDFLNTMFDGQQGHIISATDLPITKNVNDKHYDYVNINGTSVSATTSADSAQEVMYTTSNSEVKNNISINMLSGEILSKRISILEKVKRLAELQDPDLIDIEYIQFFAKNLGYNVNINRAEIGTNLGDLTNQDATSTSDGCNNLDKDKYLRFIVRNLPTWYKIKTTENAIKVMLYSFGLIGDLITYYSNDYDKNWRFDRLGNLTNIPEDYYPTPHYTVQINVDNSLGSISFDYERRDKILNAIESIRPINSVFESLSGYVKRLFDVWVVAHVRTRGNFTISGW